MIRYNFGFSLERVWLAFFRFWFGFGVCSHPRFAPELASAFAFALASANC
ncbi:hypothetical protein K788_0007490 [Paraburkholderia caribensis MBA4]|uniref:Uncharacterized protein n=1 Tax=Paraburkholderia caribensis MBA4 TaxID=1323664 RepID=A0A0P0RC29_9BURK|nr:hypothetical protein K788_0007490 [Paraburkholderia caribensis MBA4]